MTYTVSGGTLNPTHSLTLFMFAYVSVYRFHQYVCEPHSVTCG